MREREGTANGPTADLIPLRMRPAAELIGEGQALARQWHVGSSSFLRSAGVGCEADYKRQRVAGGHLMLFLARTPHACWKPPFPAPKLFWAIVGTQILAVFMSAMGWGVPALPWNLIGWVWVYNLAWMVVQDLVKVCVYRELDARSAGTTSFLKRLKTHLQPHGQLQQG